jgi:hypothetical protein
MAERARGLGGVQEGEDPQKVAADMLVKLGVDVRPPHPQPTPPPPVLTGHVSSLPPY